MAGSITLDGPRVPPASGRAAEQLVLLLHGYGADGNDLIGLAPYWQRLLPDAAFVAPNGPERVPGAPFGFQWFSLAGYDPDMMRRDPAQAAETYRKMRFGAEGVSALLNSFLDAELARHRLPAGRLALVGFSQGTMMALHVGLRRPEPCAGILGFSGALPSGDWLPEEIRSRPPVLLLHGDADEVVPIEAMYGAANSLAAAEVSVQWHVCPGTGHGIDQSGLDLGGRFLQEVLLGR